MLEPDQGFHPWRPRQGELISAACALALLVIMFGLEWYGFVGPPGRRTPAEGTSAENAWRALTVTRWLMLITITAALGAVALHATQRSHGSESSTGLAVSALAGLTSTLLIYRVLIDPPAPGSVVDVKLGALLGVICALGIAVGGYQSVRDERAQRRSGPG